MFEKLKLLISSIYIQAIVVFGIAIYAIYAMTNIPFSDESTGIRFVHGRQLTVEHVEDPDPEGWLPGLMYVIEHKVDDRFSGENYGITVEVLDNEDDLSAEQIVYQWVDNYIALSGDDRDGWVKITNKQAFEHELGKGYTLDVTYPIYNVMWPYTRRGKLAAVENGDNVFRFLLSINDWDRTQAREFWKVVDSLEVIR